MLKRMTPHCIERTGGLFVAVTGDDEKYIADFPDACSRCNIPVKPVDIRDAREMEPALSPKIIAAFEVDDATIDPFKLSLNNIAHAQEMGSRLLRYSRVAGFEISGGRILKTTVIDELTGKMTDIKAEVVVNASGAWAGGIAQLAGIGINMRYSKGSLLVTQKRIAHRVINRLRMPTDGDILVPGGTVSILGTTSSRVASPDVIYPETHEIDAVINEGTAIIPELADTRYIRAYCGVRPLTGDSSLTGDEEDDRSVSRGYELIDHALGPKPVGNFITITGGKLTTYRLMAEKTADMVCRRIGVRLPCRTHIEPLPDMVPARWTEPGLAPDTWIRKNTPGDKLLCECEMVSESVVKEIAEAIRSQNGQPTLKAIGLRSRIGKGPCQGTFCSQCLAAYLYDNRYLESQDGSNELRAFLRERWRGQHPLLWNNSLVQAELLEAMHCGLFSIELPPAEKFDNMVL